MNNLQKIRNQQDGIDNFCNLTIYIPQKFLYNGNVIKVQEERGIRMLNSKFVKPARKPKKYNSYILHVKGDWNDSDYITEETEWDLDGLNYSLPYLSILVDLFDFDCEYRERNYSTIFINEDLVKALERYFDKVGFYPELLALKNAGKILSKRLLALSEDEFKKVYEDTITNLKEDIEDECIDSFPTSYTGDGIHTIEEMYIEYQGNKFNVQSGKAVEALAELMDREYSK